jgi:DNA-binding transcriptional ArsR family regulator
MGLGDVFRALGDPTRRQILELLRDRDRTAGELAEHFPLAKSTLSGHFAALRQADLVVTERQGTRIVYSFNASALDEAVGALASLVGHRADVKRAKRGAKMGVSPGPRGTRKKTWKVRPR